MRCELRDYQKRCLDSVNNKINSGVKRLSVIIPAGLGRCFLALALAEQLESKYKNDVTVVIKYKKELLIWRQEGERIGTNFANFQSFEQWLRCNKKTKYLIFEDLTPFDRLKANKIVNEGDAVTISFSSFPLNNGEAYDEQTFENGCAGVFATNKVLDVHDVRYADESEVAYAKKWRTLDDQIIEDRIQKILEELKQSKTYRQYFGNYTVKNSNEVSLETIKRENASLRAEIRNLNDELKRCKSLILKLCENIADLKNRALVFETLLQQVGISQTELTKLFSRIEAIREDLDIKLKSTNESLKELAQRELQDKMVCVVTEFASKTFRDDDWAYFENILRGEFGSSIWNRLKEESKKFLITAKSMFSSMSNKKDGALYEYSGICMLVTKSLELEVTRRFLSSYKDYLKLKYDDESRFPNVLRRRNGRRNNMVIIDEEHFTLGDVIHILGVNYDKKGHCLKWRPSQEKTDFLEYAKKELFDPSKVDRDKIENSDLHR